MKLNMICVKFDQKNKNLKNLNFELLRFLGFFKPKKPRFFEAIFQPSLKATFTSVASSATIAL